MPYMSGSHARFCSMHFKGIRMPTLAGTKDLQLLRLAGVAGLLTGC